MCALPLTHAIVRVPFSGNEVSDRRVSSFDGDTSGGKGAQEHLTDDKEVQKQGSAARFDGEAVSMSLAPSPPSVGVVQGTKSRHRTGRGGKSSKACKPYKMHVDTDWVKGDMLGAPLSAAGLQECCSLCSAEAKCVGVTFLAQRSECWLKAEEQQLIHQRGIISSVICTI